MIPEPDDPSRSAGPPAARARRVLVPSLAGATAGSAVPLPSSQSHHLRHARRMRAGDLVEVFDESGSTAAGRLELAGSEASLMLLGDPRPVADDSAAITICSAVPKGSRADWMVEKLAELGVAKLLLLTSERSVVEPGAGKLERFARIAREAAQQSRSARILQIAGPVGLDAAVNAVIAGGVRGAVLTTEQPGQPLVQSPVQSAFIGPEGGWTAPELQAMLAAGLLPARLTDTVLRVETAAVCAAGILCAGGARRA